MKSLRKSIRKSFSIKKSESQESPTQDLSDSSTPTGGEVSKAATLSSPSSNQSGNRNDQFQKPAVKRVSSVSFAFNALFSKEDENAQKSENQSSKIATASTSLDSAEGNNSDPSYKAKYADKIEELMSELESKLESLAELQGQTRKLEQTISAQEHEIESIKNDIIAQDNGRKEVEVLRETSSEFVFFKQHHPLQEKVKMVSSRLNTVDNEVIMLQNKLLASGSLLAKLQVDETEAKALFSDLQAIVLDEKRELGLLSKDDDYDLIDTPEPPVISTALFLGLF